QELERRLQALSNKCLYPVNETMLVIVDLHIKLSEIVKKEGIDLVVCGHHHNLLSRFFSSIPKVVNEVEADLLIVYLDE
ncbi:universal stress protein, partial [Vibrio parahaemolyticus]|nr:universal stress protein [Vibrio parahaemolyticus]